MISEVCMEVAHIECVASFRRHVADHLNRQTRHFVDRIEGFT